MKFKNVIFDLDGTLVSSHESIYFTLEKVFTKFNASPLPKSEWRTYIGPSLVSTYKTVGIAKSDIENAVKYYQDVYKQQALDYIYPFDGVIDLLTELKTQGVKLFIASTKNEDGAISVLKKLKLIDFFDYVAGGTDDQKRSEKEEIITYLLHQAKITDKANTVMVGDTFLDIKGAKDNGLSSIGVTYGYGNNLESADYIVNSITELKNLLLK